MPSTQSLALACVVATISRGEMRTGRLVSRLLHALRKRTADGCGLCSYGGMFNLEAKALIRYAVFVI